MAMNVVGSIRSPVWRRFVVAINHNLTRAHPNTIVAEAIRMSLTQQTPTPGRTARLNGGLLGITDLMLRAHVMAGYLSQDWSRD